MSYHLSKELRKNIIFRASKKLMEYCVRNNLHFVITGASGGLDSSVTLGLAEQACKLADDTGYDLSSVALIMPCHSRDKSVTLGTLAAKKFKARMIKIELTEIFDRAYREGGLVNSIDSQIYEILKSQGKYNNDEVLGHHQLVAQGNIKARLRMMFGTYHVARMLDGMVLSTDNLSEYYMAFWTICGDVGDFAMIQNIFKGLELYDIARDLGVPEEIINAKPDDGLNIAGGDEEQLKANYETVDTVIIKLIKSGFDPEGSLDQLKDLISIEGVSDDTVYSLAERCLKGSFKRRGTIKISRKELGLPAIDKIEL